MGESARMAEGWAAIAARLRDDRPLLRAQLHDVLDRLGSSPPTGVWHPTGFIVVALHDDAVGALRLHLWPPHARELGCPCWPVHDHAWRLRSRVLCGTIHSLGYTVDDDPQGEAVLYEVCYGEPPDSVMHRGSRRVSVRARAPQRVPAGDRYVVEAGAFHASQVEAGQLAATLVATRRSAQPRPWVVGPVDGPSRVPVQRVMAGAGQVGRLVEQVRQRLV